MKNRKGNLAKFQSIVIIIMTIGILVGASLLAIGAFKTSIGENLCSAETVHTSYSETGEYCYQPGNTSNTKVVTDEAYNGTASWQTASQNLSAKAPTAGTLFGIAVILVAVFGGIFYFMGKRGGV